MNKENQENYVDIDENPIPVLLVRQGVDQTWNPKACDDLDKWKKDHQVPHIIPLNMEQMKKVRRSRFRNKRKRNEKEEEKNNSNIISLPSIEKAKKSEKINVYKRKNTHINSIESIEDNSYLEFQGIEEVMQ